MKKEVSDKQGKRCKESDHCYAETGTDSEGSIATAAACCGFV